MDDDGRPFKAAKLYHTVSQEESAASVQASMLAPPNSTAATVTVISSPAPNDLLMSGAVQSDGVDSQTVAYDAFKSEAQARTDTNVDQDGESISKNKRKKMLKRQEWEARREDRKVIRKEKRQARRERKREERQLAREQEEIAAPQNDDNHTNATGAINVDGCASAELRQHSKPITLPITFIIDCSFDELMMEGEITSLASQLTRCYSDNRKASPRVHLAISSFDNRLKARFETSLQRMHENWRNVQFRSGDFMAVAEEAQTWMTAKNNPEPEEDKETNKNETTGPITKWRGQIIYLSSDAEETLTELNSHTTYVIGGLVDRNRHKRICHKRAEDLGIKTAKLPIGEYIQMASRKVLTVNHVNEIMLKWLDYRDWAKAFEAVIPKRKGGVLKSSQADNEPPDGDNEAGELEAAPLEEFDEPAGNDTSG